MPLKGQACARCGKHLSILKEDIYNIEIYRVGPFRNENMRRYLPGDMLLCKKCFRSYWNWYYSDDETEALLERISKEEETCKNTNTTE